MKKSFFLLSALGLLGCAGFGFQAPPRDSALKGEIISALKQERGLDISHVYVDVDAGAVVISGMVDSVQQEKLLEKIVYHVRGVKEPTFNLAVKE
jgi:osmotically-inducible protein OsmY